MGNKDPHLSCRIRHLDCLSLTVLEGSGRAGICGGVGRPGFNYPSNQVTNTGKSLLLPEPYFLASRIGEMIITCWIVVGLEWRQSMLMGSWEALSAPYWLLLLFVLFSITSLLTPSSF